MTKTLLIASLFAIALSACSKKQEAPAPETTTPPAASAPAATPAAPTSAPAAEAPASTTAPASAPTESK